MPYFNPKKCGRAIKVANKKRDELLTEYLKVVPTCFKLPDVIKKIIPINAFYAEIKHSVKGRIFYTCNQNYFVNNKIMLSSLANWLINYICYIIDFDSNVVRLNVDDISLLINKKPRTIYDAIQELDDVDIIKKTDMNKLYVINHNIIFKGDMELFLYNYYDLYGKGKAPMGDQLFDDIDYINGKIKTRRELKIKNIVYGKSESTD